METSYGQSQVLFGIDLKVNESEVVTLLGRNGMGKTTTINSIMGLVKVKSGEVIFVGDPVQKWPSHRVARSGVGLVPEGRQIFPNLSVYENLVATAANRFKNKNPWTLDRVFKLFPRLTDRLNNMGNQLSGGEQQMLSIGRALMTNPRLLILDEATEGLAPLIKMEIWDCLRGLKSSGQSILVVDKNIAALTKLADRHYIMEKGKIVWTGDSSTLNKHKEMQHRYLGI
ncbi:MAG: High-affinity branched-chain amino acid transport ATP-binding protein LivF [Deltaproteobacteria bacterium]|jgi:branched-chain amino acid transport system ATP-binding protein|nr:High-affinity branched-chain amino acid transport ATP-binding protein LivF [Deltaproteobacteria bacterium]